MLVHISVRNSAGDVHLDKVVNDAEARRVMDKAIEKGAEFSCRHHKAKAPPRIDGKQHDEAVKAAGLVRESDIEEAYATGYAAMVAKIADALGVGPDADEAMCFKAIIELQKTPDEIPAPAPEATAPSKATPAKQSKK